MQNGPLFGLQNLPMASFLLVAEKAIVLGDTV